MRLLFVAVFAAFTVFGIQAARAATYTISPGHSISSALGALRAGDTLYLHGGTYTENVSASMSAGSSGSPIYVKAYPGERPVVVGLFWISNPVYVVFDGINVTWNSSNSSGSHMVKMTGGSDWQYVNSEIWGAHSYAGMLISKTTRFRVAYNCVHDTYPSNSTNQDHNIYASGGATNGVIERNILFNATNGAGIKFASPSSSDPNGPSGNTFRYNTVYNQMRNLGMSYTANNNTVTRNIFVKSASYGSVNANALVYSGNSAFDNIGYAAGKGSFFYTYGGGNPIHDGGGNVYPEDPQFDSIGCSGFHPLNTGAQAYGRYAGQTVTTTSSPTPTPAPSPTPTPVAATSSPTPAPSPSPVTTVSSSSVLPVDDTEIADGSRANNNYGTASILHVQSGSTGSNRIALLKFDITGFSSSKATKLRLYSAMSSTGSGSATVLAVASTAWSESTVTYNTRPAFGSALGSFSVTSTSYAAFDVDVSSYVAARKLAGATQVSFAVTAPVVSSNILKLHTKENSSGRPLLIQ